MADPDEFKECADSNIERAAKLVMKLLRARGCDDPDAVLAEALMTAAIERMSDLVRVGLVEVLDPANDTNPDCRRRKFGEDLLD